MDAVLAFNEGNRDKIKALVNICLGPGKNCISILNELDKERIRYADRSIWSMSKQRDKEKGV